MRSRYNPTKRIVSLFISLLLVLTVSLIFGQVLGNLYLENLVNNNEGQSTITPVRETTGKTNVLRLNEITYYTIEVAAYQQREKAVQVANILAEQGWPVVITGTAPFRVRLGFLNKAEKLASLAQTITVDGKKAQVIEEKINAIAYKFPQGDQLATEKIAPYLGEVSLALEKAALLNTELDSSLSQLSQTKPKFLELGEEIADLASEGQRLAPLVQQETPQYAASFSNISLALDKWSNSLMALDTNWSDQQLLVSQQHTIAVIEEYNGFLQMTN